MLLFHTKSPNRNRSRFVVPILIAVLVCGASAVAKQEVIALPSLEKTTRQLIAGVIGQADPAEPYRLASTLGPRQIVSAFYKGTRLERLIALDAAVECRNDPFYVAPSLAALMGAEDRQVASRAAHALDSIIRRELETPEALGAVVPKQVTQLVTQLMPLSRDRRLNLDIRIVAMNGIAALEKAAANPDDGWLDALLKDEDPVVRRQAVGLLTPPLRTEITVELAKMVTDDGDLIVKGQAAALLCENALAHGAQAPSADLADYLTKALQTPGIPITALGGILACLSRFDEDTTTALVDIAMAHPDPAVKSYWKAIRKK